MSVIRRKLSLEDVQWVIAVVREVFRKLKI